MSTITYHALRVDPQTSFDIAVWQDQPDLRRQLGEAACNYIRVECSVARVAQHYAAFLQTVCANVVGAVMSLPA